MLSFEYGAQKGALDVFLDEDGKQLLIRSISRLKAPGDHDHLMTPTWAGWELAERVFGEGHTLVNKVTIRMTADSPGET